MVPPRALTPGAPVPSALHHLACSACPATYDAGELRSACTCGAPLVAEYDLELAARLINPATIAGRAPDLWRYRELLPVTGAEIVTMGEGYTPLLAAPRLGSLLGLRCLRLKDDGMNPGGTFKARGAAVGVTRARELGATTVAMATNGNAGAAWALYAARAGLQAVVVMPEDARAVPQAICAASGGTTYLVRGLISDAAAIVARGCAAMGWTCASTFREPYRLEGKKTIAYEIAEQLGWRFPDVVVFPAGGGVAVAAFYKACQELQALGWIDGDLPRLTIVQAQGCAPLVDAFRAGKAESEFFQDARTFAHGLRVPRSAGDRLVLRAIAATAGHATVVSDDEIRAGMALAARSEGLYLCPEAGATVAGLLKLRDTGEICPDDEVVLFGSGGGLQYPDELAPVLPVRNADWDPAQELAARI